MAEVAVLTAVSVATVVDTRWPLPMLLSVSVMADRRRWLLEVTEVAELTVAMVVDTRWPLPMLLSVSVAADGRR